MSKQYRLYESDANQLLSKVPAGAAFAVRAFWELNRLIDDINKDPDDAWHSAAQRAAQHLRACGAADRGPAAPLAHAPALARLGESAEPTLEERKVAALEAIAEAARLWTVSRSRCSYESVSY